MTLLEKRYNAVNETKGIMLEEVISLGRDIIESLDLDLLRENANLNGKLFR